MPIALEALPKNFVETFYSQVKKWMNILVALVHVHTFTIVTCSSTCAHFYYSDLL